MYIDTNRCIVLDPSPEVQQTVRLFFAKFEELGSCLKLVRYFRSHTLLLPNRYYDGNYHSDRKFGPMTQGWARTMLHNPMYAGIYAYGRSRTDIQVISTETMETGSRRVLVPREEWAIVIRDNHEAYITEEGYRRNLQRLKDNRTRPESPGAINRGSALLQGLVRCGVCGRLMQVKYPGKHRRPVYDCIGTRGTTGEGGCQFVAATKVETTVVELVLEAFAPAQLELAETNLMHLQTEAGAIHDQWKLQLRDAEREVEAAGRLFKQAATQNRHVAGQLQNEWEKALQRVEQIKQVERDLPPPPSPEALAATVKRLSTAAQHLDVIWRAPSTRNEDRKQLLRLLIKDVVLLRKTDLIHMTVRWGSGGRLEMEIPWLNFPRSHASDPEVLEIIKEMAATNPDRAIAEKLNALGYRRRWRQTNFTGQTVNWIRTYRNIPLCPDLSPADSSGPRGDGRYNTRSVAKMLRRTQAYISQLCKQGKLDAMRSSPTSPWWIDVDSPQFEQRREALQKRKATAPREPRKSRTNR